MKTCKSKHIEIAWAQDYLECPLCVICREYDNMLNGFNKLKTKYSEYIENEQIVNKIEIK